MCITTSSGQIRDMAALLLHTSSSIGSFAGDELPSDWFFQSAGRQHDNSSSSSFSSSWGSQYVHATWAARLIPTIAAQSVATK